MSKVFSESVRVAYKLEVGTSRHCYEIRQGKMQGKNEL
jgi:hypothetical protein